MPVHFFHPLLERIFISGTCFYVARAPLNEREKLSLSLDDFVSDSLFCVYQRRRSWYWFFFFSLSPCIAWRIFSLRWRWLHRLCPSAWRVITAVNKKKWRNPLVSLTRTARTLVCVCVYTFRAPLISFHGAMELAGVWWAVVIVLHTFACWCTTKISISLFLPLLLCYDIRIIKEKASKQVDAGIGDIRRSQSPPSAGPFFFLFLISFCVCVVSLKPTERSHYSGRCRDGLKGNDEIEFLHLLFRNSSSDGLDNRAFIQTRLIECIRMPRSIWTVSFFFC